MIRLLSLKL